MTDPNFIILYVADATRSADFYTDILGKKPVESSPGFAMFALESGAMLGFWAVSNVKPTASPVGGAEIAFAMANDSAVSERYTEWAAKGLPILQTPTKLDFGFTFVATDPDGHRLRVFAPGA
jgi:catechol 2,3-dioxygenase-like lactoylglutathione lyase family enzyme